MPNLRKRSLATEPSETDITDNGNRLHDLKTQSRQLRPVDGPEQIDPLEDRLVNSLEEPYPEKKGFFPRDVLTRLVDEECVFEKLRSNLDNVLDDDTIRGYARRICGLPHVPEDRKLSPSTFKKIFVILVLSERVSTILKFIAGKVTDDDLPLAKVPRRGKPRTIFDLGKRGAPDIALECFRGWNSVAIRRFEEWQWTVISPFFARSHKRKNVTHFVLQDQAILPFISDSRRGPDALDNLEFEGGYSEVFKVEIHPEHHDFHDSHVSSPLRDFGQ